MPKGTKPVMKFVIPEGDQRTRFNLGAVWATARENIYSCRIKTPEGEELSFIAVPYQEDKQEAAAPPPASKPAPRQTRPRASNGPRPAA